MVCNGMPGSHTMVCHGRPGFIGWSIENSGEIGNLGISKVHSNISIIWLLLIENESDHPDPK